MLTPTDQLNIVCFVIFMGVSVACIIIAKKMKLPIWKFQNRMDIVDGYYRGTSFSIALKSWIRG